MEARLGGADRNLQDGGTFFECEIVLIVEQEDGSTGGRDVVEEGQEGLVGWLAKTGVEGSEVFGWCVFERLPATGAFEMREGYTRSDPEGPGAEDGGLAQERELAEDLERSLLEDVVGEGDADKTGDVAAQRCIAITEKLFQRGAVAGLREKDEEGLVRGRGLLRLSSGVHA
jgi:hypothetical protein